MRGKRYKITAFLVFFAIIQISALNYVEIYSVKPNILLASVIILALYRGSRAGIEVGIIAGLLYDLGRSNTFGFSIILFALYGYVVGLLGKNVYKESVLLRCLIVFIFSLTTGFIHYIFSLMFQPLPPFAPYMKQIVLPYSFYTTLVSPLVFLALKRPFLK